MTKSFFGTDGIRGAVGVEPITPQTIVHLGWALGTVIKKHYGNGSVLVCVSVSVSMSDVSVSVSDCECECECE